MTIKALTREESERTADVAAKVEEVVAAVNRQDAQLDFLLREVKRVENLVTGEGEQAVDGKGEALTVDDRLEAMQATWQTMSESYVAACAEAKQLRAERDAAQARVAELEKEDTERLERGREKARHVEKEIATLKRAVREARGHLDYGHIWTPNDTQYVRDAIAALSAALDEEATDAE